MHLYDMSITNKELAVTMAYGIFSEAKKYNVTIEEDIELAYKVSDELSVVYPFAVTNWYLTSFLCDIQSNDTII